jgi:alkyl sulfatase BDS1-like metallo-beta-lactamase superfamily hydrolase
VATTARSTTTSRPSISATSAGSTATRRTCGRIRPRRPASATSRSRAARTRCSPTPARRSSAATSDWVAELVDHLVFADPSNAEAKELQARTLEQLAYGAENGTWRNFFLMGAHELRHGSGGTAAGLPPDFVANLSDEQLFDALAIQVDGPRAGDRRITLHWRYTDTGGEYAVTLQHGVLTHRRGRPGGGIDATLSVARDAVNELVAGAATVESLLAAGRLAVEGDAAKLGELLGLLDPPDPGFSIVTP